MNRLRVAAAASFIALSGCAQQPSVPNQAGSTLTPLQPVAEKQADQMRVFTRWLQGEFDNNAFIVQQKTAAQGTATGLPEHPVDHLHTRITPLDDANLGMNWLMVQETLLSAANQADQIRFFQLSEDAGVIKMRGFAVLDSETRAQLTMDPAQALRLSYSELRADPVECTIFWRFLPLKQHFSSARSAPNCDELQTLKGGSSLSVTGIEHANESPPQARNRFDKARIFQVSGQISHALKTSAPTGKYSVVSVTLHDQGARIALPMDRQGKPSGFALKLEQQSESTKHPGTLHLSLINEQTGALEAEAWSDHNADTIGLNLKWIRINATAVAASH